MLQLLFFLLPVAASCGWYFGCRHGKLTKTEELTIPHDYFLGLNYLINEQPDKAVDVFIKMLEVNTDTVETHLALGSLFRRRGEVDRAIRIHQNLIARPQLLRKQRVQALFELAQDYLRAGVLDRAERLFLELIELDGEMVNSLNSLINIYQQQKDWQQAIATAKKLEKLGAVNINSIIAHYYCELAEQAWHSHRDEQAHKYLLEARTYDNGCVRTSIILGQLLFAAGDYQQAIEVFHRVYNQDQGYLSEVLGFLAECYSRIGNEKEFADYLTKWINERPNASLILAMVDYIYRCDGHAAAIEYLAQKIHLCPSMRGLDRMLELYLNSVTPEIKNQLQMLKDFIDKIIENKPFYRCTHCGFSGKQLYWQCPSCKRWNAVKPIYGLELD